MTIIQPHENDILLGRGCNHNKHSGNAQLRRLVQMHCSTYKKSNKKTKSTIAWELVKFIQNLCPPGRFLRKKNTKSNEWEIVDDKIAKEKMNQSLRDAASGKDLYKNMAVQESAVINSFTTNPPTSCFLPQTASSSTRAASDMNLQELQHSNQQLAAKSDTSDSATDVDDKASAATSAALLQLLNQEQLSMNEDLASTNGFMNRSYSDIHASLLQQLQHQQQLQQLLLCAAQQEQIEGKSLQQQQQNQSELFELLGLFNQQSPINGLPPSFNGSLGVRSPIVEANTQIGTARHAFQRQELQQTVNAVNYLRALIVAEEIRKRQL